MSAENARWSVLCNGAVVGSAGELGELTGAMKAALASAGAVSAPAQAAGRPLDEQSLVAIRHALEGLLSALIAENARFSCRAIADASKHYDEG